MKMLLNGLALALLVQTSPAFAQPNVRTVNYADLDLSRTEGQAALESRLRAAVKQVCGRPGVRNLKEMIERRECRRIASAQAKADMSLAIRKQSTVRVARAATAKP